MENTCLSIILLITANFFISGVQSSATFTFVNRCDFTVWPGILSSAGTASLSTTGFSLPIGQSQTIDAPAGWGGRFWGRTYCSQDSSGQFSCVTGDCGSGKMECAGGAAPPVTLAEFKLDGDNGMDFYDVSLVDGYNLPMLVAPQGGTGANCSSTGCLVDLNGPCPSELRVTSASDGGAAVACRSACEAFGDEQYCCSGAYASPDVCRPSQYSEMFKSACPHAYSYAFDDRTSTFTCTGADYTITFCPSPNTSQKSSSTGQTTASDSTGNSAIDSGDMVYEGASDASTASPASTCTHVLVEALAVVVATWRLSRLV